MTAANLAIVAGDDASGNAFEADGTTPSATAVPDTSKWRLRWDKLQLWNTAITNAGNAEVALSGAVTGDSLETLRGNVVSTTTEWTTENDKLTGYVADLVTADEDLTSAKEALAAAVLTCQIAAYNTYRETLENAMVARLDDLKTIKGLMETELETPEPGTVGARCEKALSNGTFRPQRGEMTCVGTEENPLCCGASRVWMAAGTNADGVAVEQAMWRTIETC